MIGAVGFLLILCLAACSTSKDAATPDMTAEEIYKQADGQFKEGEYAQASKTFDLLEREYPYSDLVAKAQVMSAFSYYQGRRYDDAIMALDRFLHMNPAHREAPWAYYLRAQCFYERIADPARDQQMTREALQRFTEVERRFPDTDYARDAALKMELIKDHLAGHEMTVGRFYHMQKNYTGALSRFLAVVDRYDTSTQTPEALYRMVEIYATLGLNDDAKKYAVLLGSNHPASDWYKRAYDLVK